MTNTPLKEKRRNVVMHYVLALLFGMITLVLSTIAINYGLIPMLPIKDFSLPFLGLIGLVGLLGFGAFEAFIHFQINYDKVIEHRKKFYEKRKKRPD